MIRVGAFTTLGISSSLVEVMLVQFKFIRSDHSIGEQC